MPIKDDQGFLRRVELKRAKDGRLYYALQIGDYSNVILWDPRYFDEFNENVEVGDFVYYTFIEKAGYRVVRFIASMPYDPEEEIFDEIREQMDMERLQRRQELFERRMRLHPEDDLRDYAIHAREVARREAQSIGGKTEEERKAWEIHVFNDLMDSRRRILQVARGLMPTYRENPDYTAEYWDTEPDIEGKI